MLKNVYFTGFFLISDLGFTCRCFLTLASSHCSDIWGCFTASTGLLQMKEEKSGQTIKLKWRSYFWPWLHDPAKIFLDHAIFRKQFLPQTLQLYLHGDTWWIIPDNKKDISDDVYSSPNPRVQRADNRLSLCRDTLLHTQWNKLK